MMGYGYDGGNGWMWGFGGWLMLGTLALIGLVIWWAVSVANRPHYSPIAQSATARRLMLRGGIGRGNCWTIGTQGRAVDGGVHRAAAHLGVLTSTVVQPSPRVGHPER